MIPRVNQGQNHFICYAEVGLQNKWCLLKISRRTFLNKIYNINSKQLIDKKWLDLFSVRRFDGQMHLLKLTSP